MCTRKILIPVFFITVTVLTRTLFHIGDNIEFLTATGLASSFFLNKKLGFLTIFVSLIISDFIIGNSSIFIFTWTGFLFSPLLSETIRRRKFSLLQSTSVIQGLGLLSTIIFFLWTNFGVVVTTNMYSKNLEGLLQSYINGLPFLYNQLAGNAIIVPAIFLATHIIINWNFKISLNHTNTKLETKYDFRTT